MLSLKQRIDLIIEAGESLKNFEGNEEIMTAMSMAGSENSWFTEDNIKKSISSICNNYTDRSKLEQWLGNYQVPENKEPKILGLLLAGNIPFVGIHDVIAGFITGHLLKIKYSDKDTYLMKLFVKLIIDQNPEAQVYFEEVERMNGIDMVIATGSNNTARYFDYYFGKMPNIIRKNRVSVGVLGPDTSMTELKLLGEDVFSYFGLGCRNISKLYLPKGYKVEMIMEAFEDWKSWVLHNKYKNNFDYNYAIYLLNKVKFLTNGSLITLEDDSLYSRISCLHFSYYESIDELKEQLKEIEDQVQCIVSNMTLDGIKTYGLGESQSPELWDYADGVDTMKFLVSHINT